MEGLLDTLQTLFVDSYALFPAVVMGFLFLFGTFTSNIGMLFLLLGHAIVVPSLNLLSNPYKINDKSDYARYGIAGLIVYSVLSAGLNTDTLGSWSMLVSVIPVLGLLFWPAGNAPQASDAGPGCAVYPGAADATDYFNRPSAWVAHTVFFFSFVISNAMWIYGLPSPTIQNPSTDAKTNAKRQDALNQRVANRKTLTGTVAGLSVVVLLAFLAIRYRATGCESRTPWILVPLAVIATTGAAWFRLITQSCGVRPTDILGVVQNMLSPDILDNPIVCVGS